ncbi:uncharacterized protein LOC141696346 [Apium graveolens]|uniref:uncharacterized protein LOC141696346 n=1 Tax=Apium graveolens TaxID=4045 RepID=UPI003D7AC647
MKVNMQAHDIWKAVELADPKVAAEEKKDRLALAAIYQSIPEDILLSVAVKNTTKETWDAIKMMFLGSDRVRQTKVQTFKSEFEVLSMKETKTIGEFCMMLNDLVTNIRALGEIVEKGFVVKKLLRAVPSRFLQITSAMEQFGKLNEMSIEEAVGSLKAHEEKTRGQTQKLGNQLLLTEDEWAKRETNGGQLLLTKEEWLKRTSTGGTDSSQNQKFRGGSKGLHGVRETSKVKCFNCHNYGHFATTCRKPQRGRETNQEVNLSQIHDNEPALLMVKQEKVEERTLLLNEKDVRPKLSKDFDMQTESNLLYLDNGASNHMTGLRSKFKELDESITGQVKFGDGSLAIKLMSKNNMAYGIPKLLNPKEMCTGCLMSKQARGLFPSKENFL